MTAPIQLGLRETACEPPEDEPKNPGGMWYRLEREVVPLLRKIRDVVNTLGPGFGDEVNITTADSPYTVLVTDEFVRADASNGPMVINLLPADQSTVRFLSMKKADFTANAITVTADGSEDIDGGPTAVVTASETFIRLYARADGYDIA